MSQPLQDMSAKPTHKDILGSDESQTIPGGNPWALDPWAEHHSAPTERGTGSCTRPTGHWAAITEHGEPIKLGESIKKCTKSRKPRKRRSRLQKQEQRRAALRPDCDEGVNETETATPVAATVDMTHSTTEPHDAQTERTPGVHRHIESGVWEMASGGNANGEKQL